VKDGNRRDYFGGLFKLTLVKSKRREMRPFLLESLKRLDSKREEPRATKPSMSVMMPEVEGDSMAEVNSNDNKS